MNELMVVLNKMQELHNNQPFEIGKDLFEISIQYLKRNNNNTVNATNYLKQEIRALVNREISTEESNNEIK
jgi:hypothetical protein